MLGVVWDVPNPVCGVLAIFITIEGITQSGHGRETRTSEEIYIQTSMELRSLSIIPFVNQSYGSGEHIYSRPPRFKINI